VGLKKKTKMDFFKMNKYTFRVLIVFLIFIFEKNGMELSAQSNLNKRETIKIEFIETKKIPFVESEIYQIRNRGCWNGAGDTLVRVVITYERIDRLPTRNINELAAVFTAGVSFLQ